MKLIVDIPKEVYKAYLESTYCINDMTTLEYAIKNGIPLDNIKAEFVNSYPRNYMGGPELDGASCHFSLNKVLEILDNSTSKTETQKPVGLLNQSLEDVIDCS